MALSRFFLCLFSCFIFSIAFHLDSPDELSFGDGPPSEISEIDLPGHGHDFPLNNIHQFELASTNSFRIINNFSLVSLLHLPAGILRQNQLQPNASAWEMAFMRNELHIYNLQLLI